MNNKNVNKAIKILKEEGVLVHTMTTFQVGDSEPAQLEYLFETERYYVVGSPDAIRFLLKKEGWKKLVSDE